VSMTLSTDSGQKTTKLSDLAMLNPRLDSNLSANDIISFVPMAALSSQSAGVTIEEARSYSEVMKGYTAFRHEDILVAKITPCFENNKIGQAKLSRLFGFGSTEFHIIRPREQRADARFLMHFLRQNHVRLEGERKITGSAGQRRIPEHFLADLHVPLFTLLEQRRIAAILDQADALRAKRRAALAQLDEMAQAIFVEMFGDPIANPQKLPTK
jgi:type I restriction enzyme S subunit